MIRRAIRLPCAFFILAPFGLLAPVYLTGKALFWGTPALQFVPWWVWSWKTIRSGQLPLWNPQLGMGAPSVANYQSGLFYPPNWIYFILGEVGGAPLLAWGQALMVAAHLSWAAVGMGLLIRRLGLNPVAQTIGGLAFGLSSHLVARSGFLSINAAAAWLPWVILGVTDLLSSGMRGNVIRDGRMQDRRKALIGLSVIIGLQMLAGHAQTAWYTLLLAALWTGFWSFFNQKSKSKLDLKVKLWGWLSNLARSWSILGFAILLAVVLAAVQLLPTGEYLWYSHRASEVDYAEAMTYSFWPWRFLTLLAPDMFGNPARGDYWGYANYWEDANYIGLLPLLLALGALFQGFTKKKFSYSHARLIRFLFGVIVVSFVFALGSNTPVFPWLYRYVPTFDMFKSPTRFTIWAVFSLAILAGIGAHYWRRPTGRRLYWTRLGTAGAFAVGIGAGLAWYLMGDISPTFVRATALAGLWGVTAGALTLVAPKFRSQSEESGIPVVQNNRSRLRTWSIGVGVVVAVDLMVAGWGMNPGVDMEVFAGKSTTGEQVVSWLEGGRLYLPERDEYEIKFDHFFRFDTFTPDEDWTNLRATLLPNMFLLDDLPSANNFDPLLHHRYARWMEKLSNADDQAQDRLLNLMSVKVVERVEESALHGVTFQMRDALPRYRWVPCARIIEAGDEAFQEVLKAEFDPEQVVILEMEPDFLTPDCDSGGQWSIEKTFENPNKVVVQVRTNSPGYLVIADQWYPGWRAWVDGTEVSIMKANYLFRAVQLPAGHHEVILSYHPPWFYGGTALSLLSWFGVAAFLWVRK